MRILSLAITCYLGLLLVVPTHAQDLRQVTARTLCFSRVADDADIFISAPEKPHQIMLPVHGFSPEFKCQLIKNVAIFYKIEGVDDQGKPKKVIMARGKAPTGARKVLCYFVPAAKGSKTPYEVKILNDGLRDFPMGHTRVLNLFGGEVAFQFGEHVKRLKPGGMVNVSLVKKKDAYNMAPVVCKMQTSDGKWRTISETQMKFTDRKRLMVVSFIDQATRRPRLRFYKDIPLAAEPGVGP